ncbi:MAG: SUMF1/EgtB/PvdO family nonheme iron enzyme, partial [Planctomycetota bacterium]
EWDLTRGAKAEPHHYKAPGETTCFALTVDGSFAIVGGKDGGCRIFDFKQARSAGAMRGDAALTAIAVTPEGRHVAAADADGSVTLWSLKTKKKQHQLRASNVQTLAADPRGRFLLGGTHDGTLFVWQIDWEWSFSAEALQSREQINLESSFEFHRAQKARRKRNQLIGAIGGGALLIGIVVWLIISSVAAHERERREGWDAIVAQIDEATPAGAAAVAQRLRDFVASFPEMRDEAAAKLTALDATSAVWKRAEELRGKGGVADSATAIDLLPEVEAFVAANPAYAERLAGTITFLHRQIKRADMQRLLASLATPVRALYDWLITQDATAADRLLDLPAAEQTAVAAMSSIRDARRWLQLSEPMYQLALALPVDDRQVFLHLEEGDATTFAGLPDAMRQPWLRLGVLERSAFAALGNEGQAVFLALPTEQRRLATSLDTAAREAFIALPSVARAQVMTLSDTDRRELFGLPAGLHVRWLDLPPAHRTPWSRWDDATRDAYGRLADDVARDEFVQLGASDREFAVSLPDDQRARFLALPAATRRASFQPVPGGGFAIVAPDIADRFAALPDDQKREVAALSESALRVFLQLDSGERPLMLSLAPDEMEVALSLTTARLRSAYFTLKPEERAALALMPPDARPAFLQADTRDRTRCLALSARHRGAWLKASTTDRASLEALVESLRDPWIALSDADRATWYSLDTASRDLWLCLPAPQRIAWVRMNAAERTAWLALAPSDRERAAALTSPALLKLLFSVPGDWRSYFLSRPAEQLEAMLPLRLSPALTIRWLELLPHEHEVIATLGAASVVRDYLELTPAERIAFAVLDKRDRARWTNLDAAYRTALGRACLSKEFRFARLEDFSGPGGRNRLAVFRCLAWEKAQSTAGVTVPDADRSAPDLEFVLVPRGTYMMGSDSNSRVVAGPAHERTIEPILVARTELTRRNWNRLKAGFDLAELGTNPGTEMSPATGLTVSEARTCLLRLRLRFPSEAEWEYVARAGVQGDTVVADSAALRGTGWLRRVDIPAASDASAVALQPVGDLAANSFGLYDMLGNAEELVDDLFNDKHDPAMKGPEARDTGDGNSCVARGGSIQDAVNEVSLAARSRVPINKRQPLCGVRAVADLPRMPDRIDPRVLLVRHPAPSNRPEIDGFTWLREETHSSGGEQRTVQIYRWDRLANALGGIDPTEVRPETEFVLVPGGTCVEGPNTLDGEIFNTTRVVTIPPFLVSRTEVTRRAYFALDQQLSRKPAPLKDSWPDSDLVPVGGLPWTLAFEWCAKNGVRMLSENEWEYACRAGTTTDYYFGPTAVPGSANINKEGKPTLVASFPPNAFGLYDMLGNVCEYIVDAYEDPRPNTLVDNGAVMPTPQNEQRLLRGGSANHGLELCTSFARLPQHMTEVFPVSGMRIAVSLPIRPTHILLEAESAVLEGCGIEGRAAAAWGADGTATWTVDIPEAGEWDVDSTECLYRAHQAHVARIEFALLDAAQQPVPGKTVDLLHIVRALGRTWLDYRSPVAGRVTLERGRYRVRVSTHENTDGAGLMNLWALTLRRVLPSASNAPKFEGFTWLRDEVFQAGGKTSRVPIYRCEAFAAALGLKDGETDPAVEFSLVPAGDYMMGEPGKAPNDREWFYARPSHKRHIKAMLVARTEVTQKVWAALAPKASLPPAISQFGGLAGGARLPVDGVNWEQADAFCKSVGLRLPTEAEWEYACRAGTGGPTYDGSPVIISELDSPDLSRIAWYGGNAVQMEPSPWRAEKEKGPRQILGDFYTTKPVGQKAPNAFGLYDMIGNVWEVCADPFAEWLDPTLTGPEAARERSETHVVRGGCIKDHAMRMRSTLRWFVPDSAIGTLGLRPVFSAE